MQDITVSLSNNNLKVSTVEKGEFKGVSAEVDKSIVNEFEIVNVEEFSRVLDDLIFSLTSKPKKALALTFLLEPQEAYFNFVTVNKNNGEIEDQIVAEAKSKLKEVALEELYFSYFKIAPFVYQFLGVKKEVLERYMDIANRLGTTLKSVIPWALMLPKFVGTNEPAIFISKAGDKQIVALSEFNGLFFTGSYKVDKSTSELQKLVQELSIYKRKEPISKVYVFDCEGFSLNPEYEVVGIEAPNSEVAGAKGYELHLLTYDLITKEPYLIAGPDNVLNSLPVPIVPEKKNVSLVAIGSTVGVLVVAGLLIGGISWFGQKNSGSEVMQNVPQNNEVLSENVGSPEPIQEPQEQQEELKKEDLSIRVENGAGIPGIAGETQEYLENLGYTVQSIGNSDLIGRTTTLIKMLPERSDYQEILVTDMQDNYDTVIELDLEEGLEYDVLIIVGTDAQL